MLRRLEGWFLSLNKIVIGLLAILMFGLVLANVITRYFFGFSQIWSEELSSILMIWIAFLGIGLAMRDGQLVAIEVIYDYLPKRKVVPFVRIVVGLIVIAFMAYLAYLGFLYSDAMMDQKSATLLWSLGWIYMVIPIGVITFILQFIGVFRNFIDGTMVPEPTAEHDGTGDEVRG